MMLREAYITTESLMGLPFEFEPTNNRNKLLRVDECHNFYNYSSIELNGERRVELPYFLAKERKRKPASRLALFPRSQLPGRYTNICGIAERQLPAKCLRSFHLLGIFSIVCIKEL